MRYLRLRKVKNEQVAQYRKLKKGKSGSFLSWTLAIVLAAGIVFYGPGLLVLRPHLPKAHAAALSFVCANQAASTSAAACTGEQTGDLLVVFAGVTASATAPTTATGFTQIDTNFNTGGSASSRTAFNSGYAVASSSSSNSGTWTGASQVIMQVYRGQAPTFPIGNEVTVGGSNSGKTVNYAATTLSVTDGTSWFAGFAIRNSAQALMSTAPTGMTNRASTPATPVAAGHDTNGATASNWPSTAVSGFSTNAQYTSLVMEIISSPQITVGSTGTQTASVNQSSTANYLGGAFSFIRDFGTTNIDTIKITENGTINAASNLSNLILFYKQEAVCSTSIPAGTTQFNSTGGSFTGTGPYTSTVTGTMPVGTSQICVYAQADVGGGANVGDTIEIQIANPSTDTHAQRGTTSPSSAVAISGTTTVASGAPSTDQLLRGGDYFQGGTKQHFFWAS